MKKKIKTVLIIGNGPSAIGSGSERNEAGFDVAKTWKKMGINVLFLDNNPYSLLLQEFDSRKAFIEPINTGNVKKIIKSQNVDAVCASFGDIEALKIMQRLKKNGFLTENRVEMIGLNPGNVDLFNHSDQLNARLAEYQIKTPNVYLVKDFDDLRKVVSKISFPISMKAVDPKTHKKRHVFQNVEELTEEAASIFDDSRVNQCTVEREVVGFSEIGIVAIRDCVGTKMMVDSLQDVNPVGVSSNDSIVFSPAQTLPDNELENLRSCSFQIMDNLGIKGACHIQFAIKKDTGDYFVLKVNPNFNLNMEIAAHSTGYPLNLVAAQIMMDIPLNEIQLPKRFHKFTAILQPVSDHVTVKVPIWPFESLPKADRLLNSKTKEIGSVIGIGTSCEEALVKALRSSQSSPRDILPSFSNLSEDELIEAIIKPSDFQLPVLFEAILRGYSVSDLSELTKIDPFFFQVIKNIQKTRDNLIKHPNDQKSFLRASQMGFGAGMIADFWHEDVYELIRNFKQRTAYKMIEPTGGEFEEEVNSFYSVTNGINESKPLGGHTCLVIGKGKNKLGPNTASDTFTSEILISLKELGFDTVILNNAPESTTLSPLLSDKQYLEPIQLGEILDIIGLEKPEYVFVPGNRHFLIRELEKVDGIKLKVLPSDQKNALKLRNKIDLALDFYVLDEKVIPITTVRFGSQTKLPRNEEDFQTNYLVPYDDFPADADELIRTAQKSIKTHNLSGLVQIVFQEEEGKLKFSGIRPLRISETLFLNLASHTNWIKKKVAQEVNQLSIDGLEKDIPGFNDFSQFAILSATFPFKELNISNEAPKRSIAVGAKMSLGKTIKEAVTGLIK